jgi:3-hydroxyacyl-[acyl-carrier-protein] dehydratase
MSEGSVEGETEFVYDMAKILAALPHRYPMLLVDRVVALDLGERIQAVKAVSFNEPFFQGHVPGAPIMPGVLQIEALAQAAGILAVETLELAGTGKLVYFMAISEAKFRKPVTPGVLLDLEASFIQQRARVCKVAGRASVNGETTCEVQFTAMIADG